MWEGGTLYFGLAVLQRHRWEVDDANNQKLQF